VNAGHFVSGARSHYSERDVSLIALVAAILASLPAFFDLSREAAGLGILFALVLPVVAVPIVTGRFTSVDPVFFIGVMWLLAVTLPVLSPNLYRDRLWTSVSPHSLDIAALWMYRGWAVFGVAYWAGRLALRNQSKVLAKGEKSLVNRVRVIIGLVGLGGAIAEILVTGGQDYSFVESGRQTSTYFQVLFELHRLAPVFVLLHFYSRGRGGAVSNGETWLLVAVLGAQALYFLASGTKFVPMELVVAWILGSMSGGVRPKFVRTAILALAAVALAYGSFFVVTAYRKEMIIRPMDSTATLSETIDLQIGALSAAIDSVVAGRELGAAENEYDTTSILDRLGYLTAFGALLDYTEEMSPRENAWSSLATPVFAVVPRDLLGAKAQFLNPGRFAQMMGWRWGGFAVSTPGSLFWAWGFEGIVFGMMGLGLAFGLVVSGSVGEGVPSILMRATMVRMIMEFMDVGREFQSIVIGSTRTFLITLLIVYLVRTFTRAVRVSRPVSF